LRWPAFTTRDDVAMCAAASEDGRRTDELRSTFRQLHEHGLFVMPNPWDIGSAKLLAQGQTNFVRMLWKFSSVYNRGRQLADHLQPVKYEIALPKSGTEPLVKNSLYVHQPQPLAQAAH